MKTVGRKKKKNLIPTALRSGLVRLKHVARRFRRMLVNKRTVCFFFRHRLSDSSADESIRHDGHLYCVIVPAGLACTLLSCVGL